MSVQATGTQPGMPRRLWTYVVEMFPLHVNVPYSLMSFFGFYWLLGAMAGDRPLHLTAASVCGAVTLAAFTLLTRIFDEFKDYEHDLALFPDRPLPSGRVLPADLKLLGWVLTVAMLALNLWLGVGLLGFAVMLGYLLLMFKYFFLPDLHRKSLLLTLATHNPIVLFIHLYVFTIFLHDHQMGWEALTSGVALAIAMFWLPVFAWETARKIRAAEEETAYVTYSQIFGRRAAAVLPFAAVAVSAAIAWGFGRALGLGPWFLGAIALAAGYATFGFARWMAAQTPANSRLKPFVETYALSLYVAVIAALLARLGLG